MYEQKEGVYSKVIPKNSLNIKKNKKIKAPPSKKMQWQNLSNVCMTVSYLIHIVNESFHKKFHFTKVGTDVNVIRNYRNIPLYVLLREIFKDFTRIDQ